MNDAELIDRVAARMWEARWSGSPFSAKWGQASPEQQRDYRTMARAAMEFMLSGDVDGDELAQGRPGSYRSAPGVGVSNAASDPPGLTATGRQPSPSAYTPKGTPPVVDPRTPADWDGGDVPPVRDDDGLTAWERETLEEPAPDADAAHAKLLAALSPPDERDADESRIPF